MWIKSLQAAMVIPLLVSLLSACERSVTVGDVLNQTSSPDPTAPLIPTPAVRPSSKITTIIVREKEGISTSNYPLTFGMAFRRGDVPETVGLEISGQSLTTQVDVKTRYSDGSVRHAIISALVPVTANQDTTLSIVTASSAAATGELDKSAILATDIGATISLAGLSDSGYTGDLHANLRDAITNQNNLRYWLKGRICTEILVDQRLNNSLNATWEARIYPGTPYIRISHTLENVEANYRGNINYVVSINQGNASPLPVYGPKSITHLKNSRWRKVFWQGPVPPEVEIHYDTAYLISTGHIMPYDTSLIISQSAISSMAASWTSRDTDLFGETYAGGSWLAGLAFMNFPSTGGRPEIGILPKWAAMYLLSWDNRLREITLRQAELLANAPIHWREFNASKSFMGRIINIDDRPKVRIDGEADATSGSYDPLPAAIGTTATSHWAVDRSHQGSFDYIPYLITGEYFYLQELYYWAGWDLAQSHWDPSWGRDSSTGLIRDQIRGVAWALRNIADAAALAPDSDPEKAYLEQKLANNISYRASTITQYPLRNMSPSEGAPAGQVASVTHVTSPWMEDFCLLAFTHIRQIGYDTSAVLAEYSKFIVGRFSNPDFNWFNGSPYRFPTVTTTGPVQTWAEANSLYASQPVSAPIADYAFSYTYIASAALSQVTQYPNGQSAYNWLLEHRTAPVSPSLSEDPTWAIIPAR